MASWQVRFTFASGAQAEFGFRARHSRQAYRKMYERLFWFPAPEGSLVRLTRLTPRRHRLAAAPSVRRAE